MPDLPAPPPVPTSIRHLWWLKVPVADWLADPINDCPDDLAWRAAITLRLRCWHQSPAASLPGDDASLCHLAGLGRDLATWCRVKPIALAGFVLCADGRWYHQDLAAAAIEAQEEHERAATRREKAREKKRAQRAQGDDQAAEGPLEFQGTVDADQADAGEEVCPAGQGADVPRENALQSTVSQLTDPPLIPPSVAADRTQARQVAQVDGKATTRPTRGRRHRQGVPEIQGDHGTRDLDQWRYRLSSGPRFWLTSWGPRPGEAGCEAPAALVAASPWAAVLEVVGSA